VAALRDHAEGSSVPLGQCDIDLADPLLDVGGREPRPAKDGWTIRAQINSDP